MVVDVGGRGGWRWTGESWWWGLVVEVMVGNVTNVILVVGGSV